MRRSLFRRSFLAPIVVATAAAVAATGTPLQANAATFSSDGTAPDLIPLLSGYTDYWTSDGANDLHGTVRNAAVLQRNDQLAAWINNNATSAQQFKALQDAEYDNADLTAYDQSYTISDALGSTLGPLYVHGRKAGDLPLVNALINSSDGTSGAYVSTGAAKATYSYPRPFLPTDSSAQAVNGDAAACTPSAVNASSLASIRSNVPWADSNGKLAIKRVPDAVDTTKRFASTDVALSAGYGTKSLCTGGSFPSGHTTTAYQAGITLATLLPELAPEILARTSEAGNDRIVLGVHYPLDIIGGRIDGEAALAARWSDDAYRKQVLEPARAQLLAYFQKETGKSLQQVITRQDAYTSNPYGGKRVPGGTAQVVTDRPSAVSVYRERLSYGFQQTGTRNLAASVPSGAENLLLTAFPTLTDAQRVAVLAQTEAPSGSPLDQSGTAAGSWERLDLAAATSATVRLQADGGVRVVATGGAAKVVAAPAAGGHGGHGRGGHGHGGHGHGGHGGGHGDGGGHR